MEICVWKKYNIWWLDLVKKDMLTILEHNYFISFLRPVQPMLARREPKRFRRRFREALVQSQVRFNRIPEKVPGKSGRLRVPEKVSEKVWEALVQSQVRFNGVPKKVPEKVCQAFVHSQIRFNRVPEKVPEKVWEALVQSQINFNGFQRKLLKPNQNKFI